MIRGLDERKRAKIFEPQLPLGRMTKRRGENIVADRNGSVPECVDCGVCCVFALMVPVRSAEAKKLPAYWEVFADDAPEEPTIGILLPRNAENGQCVNLEGRIGEKVGCSIYSDRPGACHDFEAGSDRCHEYRRMYGLEPQLDGNYAAELERKLSSLPNDDLISYAAIVVDWISTVVESSVDESKKEIAKKRSQLKIVAFINDDIETPYVIHSYDPSVETWFESDFLGKSVDDAKMMVSVGEAEGIN